MIHSCFLGNLVSIEKFLNFWEIMFAWHCHLQDGTVCERTGVKKEVNKIAFEIKTFCGPLLGEHLL